MLKSGRTTGFMLAAVVLTVLWTRPAGAEDMQPAQDVPRAPAVQPAQDSQTAPEPAREQAQTAAMLDTAGKFRLSLNAGAGFGFERVDVGVTTGGDTVSLSGGGGFGLGAGIGYGLSRDFDLDVDLGFQAGTLTPAVENAEGSFTRGYLLGTLKYKIPSSDSGQFKIGAGVGAYFGGKLKIERKDIFAGFNETVEYKTSAGVHVTGEFERFIRDNLSFNLGAKIYFVKYKADSYTLDNVNLPVSALRNDVRDLNGNGMDVMIGMSLYFN